MAKWVQIFLFLVFNTLTISLFAVVSSPQVSCVKVLANGDVDITWQQPLDPISEFTSYNLFVSSSLNGTYTTVANITNYSTLTYTHVGANATVSPKFYYITTTSNNTTTALALDTVRTIHLVVANPNNGVANLQWNPISDPLPSGSSLNYNIYREYPTGNYTLLGTTTDVRWKDTIDVCRYFINYKVEISDASGCVSVSRIHGDLFLDLIGPVPPSIDSVSVNSSNQTVIGISPSISSDAVAFVIYSPPAGSTTMLAVDTLQGNNNIVYTNLTSNPGTTSNSFSVGSVDSCGNMQFFCPRQNTMFLNSSYSICAKSVLLGWSPYVNMKGGLLHYKIYMSVNGGPYTIVGNTTQPSFIQSNLTPNKTYRFFVRAFNIGETISSTSNIISFFTSNQSQPSYVYVESVSVQESQDILIKIKADSLKYFRGIEVYRSLSSTGPFTALGFIQSNGTTNYSISDNDVETAEISYYYKAVIVDSCGLESITSNVSRSIVLEAKSNSDRTNTLTWNNYETYLGTVVSYNIFRSVDDVFNTAPIASVSGSINTFIDDVIELVPHQGRFSYYVQAVEGNGNPFDVHALSNSNIVDTYHTDSIFVPNAFVPKGVNKVFLPMTQYVEKTEYKLTIYDRWGLKIWESADDSEGWDGEKKEGGLYAYLIEYKNAYGEYKKITGTVMMIK